MSDNLSIQPAVVQERKNPYVSAGMGAVAGAAVGGIGAYGYNKITSSAPQTHEDLVKLANEQDKAEFTTKQNAVKDAEKKLEEAGKAVYEGSEKTALDEAIKKRDAELARLTESSSSGSKEIKTKAWNEFSKNLGDLPTENTRTGKKFADNFKTRAAQVQAEYNKLIKDYKDAVNEADRAVVADKNLLTKRETIINDYLNDSEAARKKTKIKDLDKIFSTEEPSWRASMSAHTEEFKRADAAAEKIYPKIGNRASLTEEQIMSFAEKVEPGDNSYRYHLDRKEVVDGRMKTVRYGYSEEMFKEFKNAENERIMDLRNELRSSLLDNAKENIILGRKDVKADFLDTIPDDLAKKTGLTKGGKLDIDAIAKEAGDKPRFYKNDIKLLEDAMNSKGGSASVPKPIAGKLKGNYTGAKNIEEALDMARNRKDLLQEFKTLSNEHTQALKACKENHTVLNDLKDKIAEARNSNEKFVKAKENLIAQFPEQFSEVEKAGMSAEKAMEKDSYKKLAKIVEEKQAAYDKVAANKGKVNESAKKAAEDVVNKAKTELDTLFNDLKGKYSKGGIGKGAAAAIAAGVGLVGAMIGMNQANKANKAAEEAATQIIA